MKILIKNGKVFDGKKFVFKDVLTENNTILKILPEIQDKTDYVFDASGCTVSSGLVDLHVHMQGVSPDLYGICADLSCIPFGVTAAVDAGCVQGDEKYINSFLVKNKVFALSAIKDNNLSTVNTEKMLENYGDKVMGIKVCFDSMQCNVWDTQPIEQAVDFARKHNLKVMVHSTNSPVKMIDIVNVLRKGDILSHAYHGGENNAADDGFECIFKAKEKGVIIDAAMAGGVHCDFKVFEKAIKCGATPDVISTDITKCSAYVRGGKYGLTMCMSIAKTLGMREEDVFGAVTYLPSQVCGESGRWGELKEGNTADISVLSFCDNGFDITDIIGNRVKSEKGYECALCIADGTIVYKR